MQMHVMRRRLAVVVTGIALLLVALPVMVHAQSASGSGKFVSGSIPADGGIGIVVYGGGSYDQLVAAAACPSGRSAVYWATNARGEFVSFIPASAVTAVNAGFTAQFPNSTVPPNTPLIGRCALLLGATREVHLADSGSTLTLHTGETFVLALGDQWIWSNIRIADPNVVAPVPTILVYVPGTQGMYRANTVGRTTLDATGGPNCAPNQACPAIAILFNLTVVVIP